jgi:hypothetical protein
MRDPGLQPFSRGSPIGQERPLGSRRKPALQLRELQHMARLHRAPVQPFPATRKACAPLISCLTPGTAGVCACCCRREAAWAAVSDERHLILF